MRRGSPSWMPWTRRRGDSRISNRFPLPSRTRDQATTEWKGLHYFLIPKMYVLQFCKSQNLMMVHLGKFQRQTVQLYPLSLHFERMRTIEMRSFCQLFHQQPNQPNLKLYLETLEIQNCCLIAQYWRALCYKTLYSCGEAYLLYPLGRLIYLCGFTFCFLKTRSGQFWWMSRHTDRCRHTANLYKSRELGCVPSSPVKTKQQEQ